ncbi:MAG: LPXTG cell wall anchor domain-containing protein [Lactobacillus sp.]|nr:LPXTG cell wall anchor domain-containing protein [Lactobacillus sp.]MCI1918351.1 LPXTG cell wall anchor domain-containing protein [Lactobacillus sp.]MCI1941970.1 LPXTG cell wall anchor domain-containing protein [Lactobacillus sp.]MCI1972423.1 LPXTG cell wall anchor domain-containing protein [Lactobacillus sp.]MCI2036960.1 LPXTG cell wall anchor domain-containing protein [Lactobacillus sp.]
MSTGTTQKGKKALPQTGEALTGAGLVLFGLLLLGGLLFGLHRKQQA